MHVPGPRNTIWAYLGLIGYHGLGRKYNLAGIKNGALLKDALLAQVVTEGPLSIQTLLMGMLPVSTGIIRALANGSDTHLIQYDAYTPHIHLRCREVMIFSCYGDNGLGLVPS
jgi:hypothetical protein